MARKKQEEKDNTWWYVGITFVVCLIIFIVFFSLNGMSSLKEDKMEQPKEIVVEKEPAPVYDGGSNLTVNPYVDVMNTMVVNMMPFMVLIVIISVIGTTIGIVMR